jgi:hypothetical protein
MLVAMVSQTRKNTALPGSLAKKKVLRLRVIIICRKIPSRSGSQKRMEKQRLPHRC